MPALRSLRQVAACKGVRQQHSVQEDEKKHDTVKKTYRATNYFALDPVAALSAIGTEKRLEHKDGELTTLTVSACDPYDGERRIGYERRLTPGWPAYS